MDFGSFLKLLRKQQGFTLRELGAKTGISNAYLSQIETGARQPPKAPEKLSKIADALGIEAHELWKAAGYEIPLTVLTEPVLAHHSEIDFIYNRIIYDMKRNVTPRYEKLLDIFLKTVFIKMCETHLGSDLIEEPVAKEVEKRFGTALKLFKPIFKKENSASILKNISEG